jgi:superfamily I DNA and/or RNA helicase
MEEHVETDESNDSGESKSKFNLHEAQIVLNYLKKLVEQLNIKEECIGVITPYAAQVQTLRDLILPKHPFIEISTVDGFQGREKEIIIISTVRSNTNGEVGFLSESRRMNVAITRAKKHVCLICDSNCLKTNKFLSRMVQYFEDNSDLRIADDYI